MNGIVKTNNASAGTAAGGIRVQAAAGDLRLHKFRSRIFRNSRFLRLWLPPGYQDPANAGPPDKHQSMVDDVRELAAILRRAGLDDTRLRLVVEEGATHHESAWARRFPEALAFLFGSR